MPVFMDDFLEFILNCRLEFFYFGFVFLGLLGRGLFALAFNLYLTKLCTVEYATLILCFFTTI